MALRTHQLFRLRHNRFPKEGIVTKSQPSLMEITVERKGKTYHANYIIEKGLIQVSAMGRTLTTHLGSLPPDVQARMILREIIDTIKTPED